MDGVLMAILAAREERWRRRLSLAEHGTLLTLTQNVPGPDKLPPGWLAVHGAVTKDMARFLMRRGFRWRRPGNGGDHEPSLSLSGAAGAEAHFVFDLFPADPAELKRAAVEFEELHPAGRLADADVMSQGGAPVARADLGLPPRPCIVCGRPAKECAPLRRHPVEEIMAEAERIIAALA